MAQKAQGRKEILCFMVHVFKIGMVNSHEGVSAQTVGPSRPIPPSNLSSGRWCLWSSKKQPSVWQPLWLANEDSRWEVRDGWQLSCKPKHTIPIYWYNSPQRMEETARPEDVSMRGEERQLFLLVGPVLVWLIRRSHHMLWEESH